VKFAVAVLLAAVFAFGADRPLLPEQFGKYKLDSRDAAPASEPAAIATEYGLEAAEAARYKGPQKVSVTVWRFRDATGAMAFHQWQRAQPGEWQQSGSYVLRFEETKPRKATVQALVAALPPAGSQPLPSLPSHLPGKGLIEGSQRYLLGNASLQQFQPLIPAQTARFDLSAEAQIARYKTAAGEVALAIFSYPTPQIARLQLREFEKLSGAAVHRSGPLVTVAFGPHDQALSLAGSVGYQASIVLNEATKDYSGNPGEMLIAIFQMIGYILLFCMGAGLLVAGVRRFQDRGFGNARARDVMIRLHIEDN